MKASQRVNGTMNIVQPPGGGGGSQDVQALGEDLSRCSFHLNKYWSQPNPAELAYDLRQRCDKRHTRTRRCTPFLFPLVSSKFTLTWSCRCRHFGLTVLVASRAQRSTRTVPFGASSADFLAVRKVSTCVKKGYCKGYVNFDSRRSSQTHVY